MGFVLFDPYIRSVQKIIGEVPMLRLREEMKMKINYSILFVSHSSPSIFVLEASSKIAFTQQKG